MKRIVPLIGMIFVFLIWAAIDYLVLPAWNVQNFGFWVFAGSFIGIEIFLLLLQFNARGSFGLGLLAGGGIIAIALILSIGSWLIFPGNDTRFFSRLSVEDRNLESWAVDFPGAGTPGPLSQPLVLPAIDKELSAKIAQGKMGTYGAQFQMNGEIFTAVAVKRGEGLSLVRITPLDYSGTMVALFGGSSGTVGYIEVDQQTEQARLVEVSGGMKYTPGAILGRDLMRHVRSAYKSALIGGLSFEIDDGGKPYWVISEVANTIGFFGGKKCVALILVDPVSGAMERFLPGSQPAWVDRVIPSELVKDMANDALGLKNGWMNREFGKKTGVFQLSDSYNYVVGNDGGEGQTWFVSGITSPNEADQTLTGIMMVNLRSAQALRYSFSGITEMRAQEIAENDERVRAQQLLATWPILVDVDGQSAYYMFLKNSVQRQRFVLLDAATGQKVAMGDTLAAARSQFVGLMGALAGTSAAVEKIIGTVLRVKDIADGSVLFLLTGDARISYQVNGRLSNGAYFLSPGDRVELQFRSSDANPNERFVSEMRNLTIGE